MADPKTLARLAKDATANPRHNLELVGALLIGANVADEDQVASALNLLESVGVSSDVQMIAGLAALLVARVLSWLKRARNDGETS